MPVAWAITAATAWRSTQRLAPAVPSSSYLQRQVPVGEVPPGEGDGAVDGLVGDADPVVPLVPLPQPPEDALGVVGGGLLHQDALEPPLQGAVLFDGPAELPDGGGPDQLEFPPGQLGLEDVGGVHRPLRRPDAHDGVELVDKQDDVAGGDDLLDGGPYPLLKVPPVLGPRHHGGHVQAHHPAASQLGGDCALGHPLGQPLHDGGLAHPGLPDEAGVVLGPAGEDLDDPLDFLVPADDRVQPPRPGQFGKVPAVFVQVAGARRGPGRGLGGLGPAALLVQVGGQHPPQQPLQGGHVPAALLQQPLGGAVLLVDGGKQDVLGPGHGLAAEPGLHQGVFQDVLTVGGEVVGGEGGKHPLAHRLPHLGQQVAIGDPLLPQQDGGHAAILPQQSQQQVLAPHIGMAQLLRRQHGKIDGVIGLGAKTGKFIHGSSVHSSPPKRAL